jgi:type I restriction enzyme S subunit
MQVESDVHSAHRIGEREPNPTTIPDDRATLEPDDADPAASRRPVKYKQTEVGKVPEGWRVVPLGNLMEFQNGFNADRAAYGIGVPFINVLEVITKSRLTADDVPGKVAVSPAQLRAFEVRRGDVLFNRTSETQEELALASVYQDDEPVIFGGFVIRGRPDAAQVRSEYIGYGLRAPAVRGQIIARGQGAIRANVGQADLRKVLAPLPSLDEQEAIAAALGNADALIAALEALIAKKRDMKKGAMQELLTGQRRLPGFQGTWENVSVASAASRAPNSIVGGPFGSDLVSADYQATGTPVIRGQNMGTKYVSGEFVYVSGAKAKALAANCAQPSDLIFTQRGTLGQVAIVPRNGYPRYLVSQSQMKFAADCDRFDPVYFYYYFSSSAGQRQIVDSAIQTGVPHTNLGILKSYRVPVPRDRDEQYAIATVLSDIDAELAGLEAKLSKARDIKQGMMQALLTGEVRLV